MAGTDQAGNQGMGQAAGELLREMQKAQAEMQQLEERQRAGGPSEQFDKVLQGQLGQAAGHEAPAAPGAGNIAGPKAVTAAEAPASGRAATVDVLRQARAEQRSPSTRVGATERVEESKLQQMINQLVGGQDKMTKIMNMALSGRQFSPTELLAMQAGVYRFSQELDLTSKVVQQATSGIKQTLNTQV